MYLFSRCSRADALNLAPIPNSKSINFAKLFMWAKVFYGYLLQLDFEVLAIFSSIARREATGAPALATIRRCKIINCCTPHHHLQHRH